MLHKLPRIEDPLNSQLVAIERGCLTATDQVVRSCERRIIALASTFAHPGRDPEDFAQAGRLAAWRAAGAFDPRRGKRFEAYATTAIKNSFYDVVRRTKVALQEVVEVEDVAPGPSPLDRMMLQEARAALSEREAAVVGLLYDEGLTQRQAARRLSLSQARVGQVHKEALTSMRGLVEPAV